MRGHGIRAVGIGIFTVHQKNGGNNGGTVFGVTRYSGAGIQVAGIRGDTVFGVTRYSGAGIQVAGIQVAGIRGTGIFFNFLQYQLK